MTLGTLIAASLKRGLASLALVGGTSGLAAAADATPPPAPAVAVADPAANCPTCEAAAKSDCPTCHGGGTKGHGMSKVGGVFHGHRTEHVPFLCPGACFGYFQTKWNRWEDVCSHPYQGVGLTDAPRPVVPPLAPVGPVATPKVDPLPPPMPEPKKTPTTDTAPPPVVPPKVTPKVVPSTVIPAPVPAPTPLPAPIPPKFTP